MKISLAVAGALLLGSSLTACGGGDGGGSDSAYCKDLKSAKATISKVSDSQDLSGFEDAITEFHKLAAEAPDDVKSDWKTLDGVYVKIEKAFSDAGVKLSDLADIQKGKIPKGADLTKLSGLASSFTEVTSAKVSKAQKAIEKHGKDVCKVDLGTSS